MADSILSDRPDGMGYFYGFRGNDHRQINVRLERDQVFHGGYGWAVYVHGKKIGVEKLKRDAEQIAIDWLDAHPLPAEEIE